MEGWAAASLYLSDGRVVRFGPDEADLGDVPTGISFSTTNPGGFGSGSITLPRHESLYADDAKLFSHIEVYGPGGAVYYEGLVTGVPQVGRQEIELQLSGWVTVLDRVQTFRQIFVDRDLSRWTGPTTERRLALLTGGQTTQDNRTVDVTDGGEPVLRLDITAPWVANTRVEALYYGNGIELGAVYYDYVSNSPQASQPSATFFFAVELWDDSVATTVNTTGDLQTAASPGAGSYAASYLSATGAAKRYADITWYYASAYAGTGEVYSVDCGPMAVYGNHGLSARGSAPGGFYASDVIAYALSSAPDLTYTAGDSIEDTSFVIPHLTFLEDTSLRSVVEQLTALGGNQNVANDWGVYEGKEFYWRSPGTYGREWHVRRDDVAVSSSDGPDADSRVAGVKVAYTDAAGTSLSVGPPGSNADYETTQLLDSDPDNPAHRIQGAFASESMGITSQQGAINAGVMILNERNRLDWRGSIEVTGEVQDVSGNVYSPALIRAGDRIVVDDAADTSPRTIVGTTYNHDSMTTTCEIGATPDSLEAMLGQLALVTDLVG